MDVTLTKLFVAMIVCRISDDRAQNDRKGATALVVVEYPAIWLHHSFPDPCFPSLPLRTQLIGSSLPIPQLIGSSTPTANHRLREKGTWTYCGMPARTAALGTCSRARTRPPRATWKPSSGREQRAAAGMYPMRFFFFFHRVRRKHEGKHLPRHHFHTQIIINYFALRTAVPLKH